MNLLCRFLSLVVLASVNFFLFQRAFAQSPDTFWVLSSNPQNNPPVIPPANREG